MTAQPLSAWPGLGIATLAEIAALAGVSRQLVRYWVLAEGIDNARARAAWLTKEWKRRMT